MPRQQRRDLDSPWKEALQHFLPHVLQLFFPRLQEAIDWNRGYQALDKEFQQIVRSAKVRKRLADKLFKVWLKTGREAWLLIHVEIQGGVEKTFARRMFQYNYRCFDLYRRRVISLALLCDDRPGWRPDRFAYGGWGCRMAFRFPAVKLLDYASEQGSLAEHSNPVAHVVLAHLKAGETRDDPKGRHAWKIRLAKGLYGHGWNAEDVRHLFRLLDWLMDLPPELEHGFREELYRYEEEKRMPYLSSIERTAREEGRERGREEALLETIRLGLRDKFGAPGARLMPRVRALKDPGKLAAVARILVTAETLAEVRELL